MDILRRPHNFPHPGFGTELLAAPVDRSQVDALNARARALREPDARQGLALARSAYILACGSDYRQGVVESLANQSHCNSWLSNFVAALAQSLEALKALEGVGDPRLEGDVLLALSRAQLNLANFTESVDAAQRAQQLAHRSGDLLTEADAYNILGINYYRAGMSERAFAMYGEGLALHRRLENQQGVCKVLINIAQAHSTLKQHPDALAVGYEGLRLARGTGSQLLEAYTLHTLGQIYADQGQWNEALAYLRESLPVAARIGNQYVSLVSRVAMAQVYLHCDQLERAQEEARQALALAEALESKLYVYRCHQLLSESYERQGEWRRALAHYKRFHEAKELVFNEGNAHRLQSLELMYQTEKARSEAEIYYLRNVALEQEIAERRRLEIELQHQAATDALTQVPNRRRFLELAQGEIQRAARHRRPLSVALIDLDHFKQINDTYGHGVGDRALLALAQICQRNIRAVDTFARFGGDEFVLLLPETDAGRAHEVVERIRLLLAAQLIEQDGAALVISISSGVACLAEGGEDFDLLLGRADQALYQAKRAGRNRVMVAP